MCIYYCYWPAVAAFGGIDTKYRSTIAMLLCNCTRATATKSRATWKKMTARQHALGLYEGCRCIVYVPQGSDLLLHTLFSSGLGYMVGRCI